ncbi:MAG: heparinase II/III family protein, partial [Burkholderiales bacterium]|nr:heparinase II/III family protein [Opitutaceae bacterium]
ADRDPALSARTLERAIAEQAGPNAAYAPDGVYPEGPMYWAYGTTFEVILISLLEHSFGTDYGLAAAPGFLASADYLTQVTAPSGRYFNYADAREFVPPRPVLHWFAQKRGQPQIAAPELHRLAGQAQPIEGELQGIYERHDALALWWHRPAPRSPLQAPSSPPPLAWLGHGENPVAVFRSSWDNPRATYLAIKGGSPSTSHAHMDAGSFILEADGVRWAVDPGMQDYHTLENAGVNLWDGAQNGARWGIFRLGPEAHNILRFDSAPQLIDGTATFTDFSPSAPSPSATLDLTPLYRDHATSVRRKAGLLADGRIAFQDDWTAGSAPVEVTWQFLTHADITVEPRGVLLRQAGETLRLRVLSPETISIKIDDLSQPARPSDAPNPGLRRIRILVRTPAGQPGRLSLLAEPGSQAVNR